MVAKEAGGLRQGGSQSPEVAPLIRCSIVSPFDRNFVAYKHNKWTKFNLHQVT